MQLNILLITFFLPLIYSDDVDCPCHLNPYEDYPCTEIYCPVGAGYIFVCSSSNQWECHLAEPSAVVNEEESLLEDDVDCPCHLNPYEDYPCTEIYCPVGAGYIFVCSSSNQWECHLAEPSAVVVNEESNLEDCSCHLNPYEDYPCTQTYCPAEEGYVFVCGSSSNQWECHLPFRAFSEDNTLMTSNNSTLPGDADDSNVAVVSEAESNLNVVDCPCHLNPYEDYPCTEIYCPVGAGYIFRCSSSNQWECHLAEKRALDSDNDSNAVIIEAESETVLPQEKATTTIKRRFGEYYNL